MATVSYTVTAGTNGPGISWTGAFLVDTPANQVSAELPTSITNSEGAAFTPAQFESYGNSGIEYVTWRSIDISGQTPGPPAYANIYPQGGQSFDIWSTSLYNYIAGAGTWNGLDGQEYALSGTKNTVLYDYGIPYAVAYCTGGGFATTGKIAFTVVP